MPSNAAPLKHNPTPNVAAFQAWSQAALAQHAVDAIRARGQLDTVADNSAKAVRLPKYTLYSSSSTFSRKPNFLSKNCSYWLRWARLMPPHLA
eukprot:CAMPEP_0115604238 /NCGR_PEP_ID=MMETSP0272-20121206/16839_1 /TAXON_ID=71861 /ORGANISM="Scrippsiella trochoidea, Strain CCMP3099" /LENGTH=92 /DNA_ID=CAMNT_0003039783 /DNA_START=245 /DNA_END=523 /DNA_ORIENTATION=-